MILPAPLEGWQASIWCGGKELDEYQVVTVAATKTEPLTMRCFVEATEGEEFQMVTDPPASAKITKHDVSVGYTVDGSGIGLRQVHIANTRRRIARDSMYMQSPDGMQEAPLRFARLIATDKELESGCTKFDALGSIALWLKLGTIGDQYVGPCPTGKLSIEDVPEKAKKALVDQRIETGKMKTVSDSLVLNQFTYFDEIKDAVKVVFMYRSKRTLQANDVMPRDPGVEPSPEPHDADISAGDARDAEDAPILEGAAAKKRILALEAENARLRKRMRRGRADDDDTEVGSCEASAIDLTED